MKQIDIFFKFFIMTTCLFHSSVINAYDFVVDGIYYNKLSTNEVEVTYKYSGSQSYTGDVIIPSTVSYSDNAFTVTAIGNSAFNGCGHYVKSVTLPNTIRIIGSGSFVNCI